MLSSTYDRSEFVTAKRVRLTNAGGFSTSFREAMRHLPGGVSVVTVGRDEERTGLTATSVSSLSVDPPTILVCINRGSSSFPVLVKNQSFGVNVLATGHREVANRFAGRDGAKGTQRYEGASWVTLRTGAPLLNDAVVALDCELEELIERYSHAIVIGRVRGLRLFDRPGALVYWRGEYHQLGLEDQKALRANRQPARERLPVVLWDRVP